MVKKLVNFKLNSESIEALEWAKENWVSQVDFVERALSLFYGQELSKRNSALLKNQSKTLPNLKEPSREG